jgi:putative ABC transport system permease protein
MTRALVAVLSRLTDPALADTMVGDLIEERRRRAVASAGAAAWWFWRTVLTVAAYAVAARGRAALRRPFAGGLAMRRGTFRHAWRGLRTSPGFALTVMLSLGLALGANTAMFTIVSAVLLRPLPYPHPDELVAVGQGFKGSVVWEPYTDFVPMWEGVSQSLAAIGTFDERMAAVNAAFPEYVKAGSASTNLLDVLGVRPALGRWFVDEDARRGAPRVVVLGHGFWQRHYQGDANVLGRTITFGDLPATVIGVMPPGVGLPLHAEIWDLARGMGAAIVARVRPGIPLSQVQPELSRLDTNADRMRRLGSPYEVVVTPLRDRLYGSARPALRVTFGAVVLLLLIACANVANLSMARTWQRRRDFALRAALGATTWSLIRGVVAEHFLLAAAGGVLGIILASWMTRIFVGLGPEAITRVDRIAIDGGVLVFATAITLIAGAFVSVVPALGAARARRHATLVERSVRPGTAFGARRTRRVLVVAQLATALLLVTGAGLFVRSLVQLGSVSLGVDPSGVALVRLSLPKVRYPDEPRVRQFYQDVRSRVARLPGVRRVALGPAPLVAGGREAQGFSDGFSWISSTKAATNPDGFERVWGKYVDSGYFDTYRIPVREGRGFQATDDAAAPMVAVINRAAVRFYFRGRPAIGGAVPIGGGSASQPRLATVVGIVDDVLQRDVMLRAEPEVFASLDQQSASTLYSQTIAVRTTGDAAALLEPMRRIIDEIDPELAVMKLRTLQSVVDELIAPHRFLLWLLGAFAALALGLAALGLYAVVACLVVQRTPEIGVRMALGAGRQQVLMMFVRDGIRLVGLGIAAGVPAAFGLSRVLTALLFEVTPHDVWAFASAPVVLAVVALLAVYVPARRATRVDPLPLLRHE